MAGATLKEHARPKEGPIYSIDLMKNSFVWKGMFSKERREIFQGMRDFSVAKLAPETIRLHQGKVALESIEGLKEFRQFGVPKEYGGMPGHEGVVDAVMAHQNLAYGSPSAAERDGNSLFMDAVLLGGNEEQKAKYVTPVAKGEKTGCFALTDPRSGSDIGGMKTVHYEKNENGVYVINGAKIFITNGPIADYAVVYATDSANPAKYRNLTGFILRKEAEGIVGFKTGKILDKIGWRASHTSELFCDDCPATEADLLGKEGGAGIGNILTTLSYGRLKIASEALGMMERIYDEVAKFVQDRPSHDGGLLKNAPVFQKELAELAMTIDAARGMIYGTAFLAEMRDEAGLVPSFADQALRAKVFASENLNSWAKWGVNMHGGYGFTADYPVSVIYQDAVVYPTVEGATNPLMITNGAWLAGAKS